MKTRRSWHLMVAGVAAVTVAAGCSANTDSSTPVADPSAASSAPVAEAEADPSPSAEGMAPEETPTPEVTPAGFAWTEDALFDVLPTQDDVAGWGMKRVKDFRELNGVAPFDDLTGENWFNFTDAWSRVKPSKCAPVQALAFPQAEDDADLAGVAAYADSDNNFERLVLVDVATWPSPDIAQARFDAAAAVASDPDCGSYTVKRIPPKDGPDISDDYKLSYTAYRWTSPTITDHAIYGAANPRSGYATGVAGSATFMVAYLNMDGTTARTTKDLSNAATWMVDALTAAQQS